MTINKTKVSMVTPAVKTARKLHFWGVTPMTGKHSRARSVAMLTVLRDYLNLGDKEREITRILNSGAVKLDGEIVKERRAAVGFMDVINLVSLNQTYRIIYDTNGRLVAIPDAKHAGSKLVKVTGKKSEGKGKYVISFHDGQNIISEDSTITPNDVLLVSVPDKKIEQTLKLAPGAKVFMTGGSHVGETGTIKAVEVKKSSQANLVELEEGFSTTIDNVFVIGSQKFMFDLGRSGA